jgi:hypothetical protein
VATELAGLLVVNLAYAAVGAAALAAFELLTWRRLGVALPLGIAVVVIPTTYVALLGIPVGITATVVGVAVVAAAVWRTRLWRNLPSLPPWRRPSIPALLIGGVLAVLLLYAARTFAVRPLIEWDAWGIWTAKARLLYVDPSAAPAALRSGNYGQTPYPIALPTLEALGFGAMGQYDPTLIGVQFILLAMAFPLALWSLLRPYARSWVIALVALAIVGAPQILYQLLTHYADVPLALFVGLGLAAGAAWTVGAGERWLLVCFAVFLGVAGLTKSEGFLFALVGALALVVSALVTRVRIRPALAGAGGVLALVLPWRIYCSAYGLNTPDYDLGHVTSVSYLRAHTDRVGPVVRELWRQLTAQNKWGLAVWVILLALLAGLLARRWGALVFAGTWLGVSSIGLVMLYWVSTLPLESNITNTSYRTIVSLLVGGAAVAPLFIFPPRGDE